MIYLQTRKRSVVVLPVLLLVCYGALVTLRIYCGWLSNDLMDIDLPHPPSPQIVIDILSAILSGILLSLRAARVADDAAGRTKVSSTDRTYGLERTGQGKDIRVI